MTPYLYKQIQHNNDPDDDSPSEIEYGIIMAENEIQAYEKWRDYKNPYHSIYSCEIMTTII